MVSFRFLFSQSWRVEEHNGAGNITIHQLENDLSFNDKELGPRTAKLALSICLKLKTVKHV